MIEIVYPNSAGVDVHKRFVIVCCLIMDQQGHIHKETCKYTMMTADLQTLTDWLAEGGVTHVVMESTEVYWQPVNNLLEGRFELYLLNPQDIKRIPWHKTDMKHAEWIATLMQHGLLQCSFIPLLEQRELSDLTRYRQNLVQERTRFANRLQKVLEDTIIKLMSVASDIRGVPAQANLCGLLAGQGDPKILAELAKRRLHRKWDELEQALVGNLTDHHRFLLSDILVLLDFLYEKIAEVEERIETKLGQQLLFQDAVCLLDTIPEVDQQLAILIVAEIRVDMSRFSSDRHITAWAGVALGNHEIGGKRRSGKLRKGNRHLATGLVLAAQADSRQKSNYLRALFYCLASRRGKQRAAVAVRRTILKMAYHMIKRGEEYQELGADYHDCLGRERTAKRLVKRLEARSYLVKIKDLIAVETGDEELVGVP
jgi:transposase